MDRVWINLIIIGLVVLFFTVFWEIYTSFDGTRSTQSFVVTEMPRNKIFSEDLKNYLKSLR